MSTLTTLLWALVPVLMLLCMGLCLLGMRRARPGRMGPGRCGGSDRAARRESEPGRGESGRR